MSELYHYGIKGMHWGVRRFQNADGSLTAAGRARYNVGSTSGGYKGTSSSSVDWKAQRKTVINSRSRAGNVATVLANGPVGAYTYNSFRANGDSRGSAYAKTLGVSLAGPVGHVVANKLAKDRFLKEKGYKGIGDGSDNNDKKATKAAKAEAKAVKKFDQQITKNWYKPYNKAADQFNVDIKKLNEKYKGKDLGWDGKTYASAAGQSYVRDAGKLWQSLYKDAVVSEFGTGPTSLGKDWIDNMPYMDTYDKLLK